VRVTTGETTERRGLSHGYHSPVVNVQISFPAPFRWITPEYFGVFFFRPPLIRTLFREQLNFTSSPRFLIAAKEGARNRCRQVAATAALGGRYLSVVAVRSAPCSEATASTSKQAVGVAYRNSG
jgi:hypothetical protein